MSCKMDKTSWTLLRTKPVSQDRYVKQVLHHHPGIEIYVPRYLKMIPNPKSAIPIQVSRPIYPGYIFVNGEHPCLVRLPTKAHYIRFGSDISFIPDDIISELRHLESRHLLTPLESSGPHFKPGDPLIVHLPMADIVAVLIRTIASARALVDTRLGRMIVPVSTCSTIPNNPAE